MNEQMNYSLNIGEWSSVFAVPSSVVDKYIKLSSANSLKLLLFLLRHGGETFSADTLRDRLGFAETGELEDAALFWIQRGLLRYSKDEQTLAPVQENNAPEKIDDKAQITQAAHEEFVQQTIDDIPAPEQPKKPVKISPAHVSSGEIASRINGSADVSLLFKEAEKIYGRPLRQRDNQTVISLVDHYGLPVGVALMLLTYCFKINKGTPNYIGSVAADWSVDGIDSVEKADARIRALEKNDEAELQLREEFGLEKPFTPKEKTLLRSWIEELGFSKDMIKLAVDITIKNKGEFIANYVNKILHNWKDQSITTPERVKQAETGKPDGSPKQGQSGKSGDSSFSVDNIMSDLISSYND